MINVDGRLERPISINYLGGNSDEWNAILIDSTRDNDGMFRFE